MILKYKVFFLPLLLVMKKKNGCSLFHYHNVSKSRFCYTILPA